MADEKRPDVEKVFTQKWEWLPVERFESISLNRIYCLVRMAVPGGWLVRTGNVYSDLRKITYLFDEASGVTFMPDAGHAWDGNSV